jgi:hypothetical protein
MIYVLVIWLAANIILAPLIGRALARATEAVDPEGPQIDSRPRTTPQRISNDCMPLPGY